jgi:hypothetical protein
MSIKNPVLQNVIVVEVLSSDIEEFSGTKNGNAYNIRKQEAYLHSGHGYPDRFDMMLGKEQPPYKPGFYALAASSLKVDKGRLAFGWDLELTPLPGVGVADLRSVA